MRLLIIGIDGITWNVIDPMISLGRLPNLACLIDKGTRTVSTAIEHALSPISWTSIASGKLPETHSVTHCVQAGLHLEQGSVLDVLPTLLAQNRLTYIDTYDTGFELENAQTDEPASEELMSRLRAPGYVD